MEYSILCHWRICRLQGSVYFFRVMVLCRFCPSYPKLLIVPKSVPDEDLEEVAKFRVNGRIPVVVWR